jgi:hypothetical protein
MADTVRFAKTEKGADEISQRRNNLRGRLRIMLILVDPTKTAEQLRVQAARIGAPSDFLETMQHDGYIVPVGPGTAVASDVPGVGRAPVVVDESAQCAKAKTFMHDTLAAGLGPRASDLRAQVERCTTLAELAQLLPKYESAIAGVSGDVQAVMLVERLRKLLK